MLNIILQGIILWFFCGFITAGMAWPANVRAAPALVTLASEKRDDHILTRSVRRNMAITWMTLFTALVWPWPLLIRIANGQWHSDKVLNHPDYNRPRKK